MNPSSPSHCAITRLRDIVESLSFAANDTDVGYTKTAVARLSNLRTNGSGYVRYESKKTSPAVSASCCNEFLDVCSGPLSYIPKKFVFTEHCTSRLADAAPSHTTFLKEAGNRSNNVLANCV
ncbi:hypothetical protein VTN02DRAFT_5327 [Thermoascus thermophilus]